MSAIRLAFCGASGTGKTTLAEYAAKRWRLPMNPVGARSVAFSMGFDNVYDVDKSVLRGVMQKRIIRTKSEWELTNDSFVTDRTVLDAFAYSIMHCIHDIDQQLVDDVRSHMHRYTHVVYCPVDIFQDIGSDPKRIVSPIYHKMFDILMRGLLEEYCPSSVKLHKMVLDGRDTRKNELEYHLLDDVR